ncbi:hypothetical protein JCM18237_02910 [Halorubrum luteum]
MDDASTRSDDPVDARSGSSMEEMDADLDELRKRVEAEYDFDEFGPSDMARMSADEWDAVFDPETWITGDELLDRVEAELKTRIASRELFGILERVREDGTERVLVYSDEGYAMVGPDGSVAGQGTVRRDVEPVIALAAMESYDVPEPPDDWSLPHPDTVPEGSGEFGNLMMQIVAAVQLVAGAALLGAWIFLGVETIIAPAIAILFLFVGVFLFAMVANARLSDRFRAEEYRNRLRTLREMETRPEFVPVDDGASEGRGPPLGDEPSQPTTDAERTPPDADAHEPDS